MKNLSIFVICLSLMIGSLVAQTPSAFKYQAVVRNNSGQIVVNQTVGFRISILEANASRPIVYSEAHTAQTNAFGLVNLEIGNGTKLSGTFSAIDWGSGSYSVKIELDANNNGSFSEMGTSQLLAVPYALLAKTVQNYTETDPLFTNSPLNNVTSTSISNWNTAFGWGNHIGLYRPLSYVPAWDEITGKPIFATVATTGSYSDLINKPIGNNIGDMQYWDGNSWLVIPKGTSNQVLIMNETGIPVWHDLPYLSLSQLNRDVTGLAGNTTFEISSNITWTAQSDQTWYKIAIAKGNGVDTLKVNYEENTTISQRIATIVISANGLTPKKVTVTQQSSIPTDGLVAYYPFNGNANDESGNGNNGTVHGASISTDRFGNPNKSYNFNGTSDYIEASDKPILRFSNSFSISLWVSVTSLSHIQYNYTLIDKPFGSLCSDSYTIYWGSNNKCNTGYCNLSVCGNNISNSSLSLNTWYNITWVFNKTLNVEILYINGILIKSQPISLIIEYDNHTLTMGKGICYEKNQEFLDGKLDDIRLYNRSLTESEIQQLYHEGGWKK